MIREAHAEFIRDNIKKFKISKAVICKECKISFNTLQKVITVDFSVHIKYLWIVVDYLFNNYKDLEFNPCIKPYILHILRLRRAL